jgi:hypothetical protein
MEITHEYLHHRVGYRFGTHCCWLCIYEGEAGDAPVVLASEPARIGDGDLAGMSEYLAAEVIQRHFADGLPELPRPLLWVEHRSNRGRRGSGRYFLLDFPSYQPRPAGAGFVRPVTLGPPRREELAPEEVAILME